ncbi:MAG: hypothetical protein ABSB26_10060 [Nitrososphaerales archaeon]
MESKGRIDYWSARKHHYRCAQKNYLDCDGSALHLMGWTAQVGGIIVVTTAFKLDLAG